MCGGRQQDGCPAYAQAPPEMGARGGHLGPLHQLREVWEILLSSSMTTLEPKVPGTKDQHHQPDPWRGRGSPPAGRWGKPSATC